MKFDQGTRRFPVRSSHNEHAHPNRDQSVVSRWSKEWERLIVHRFIYEPNVTLVAHAGETESPRLWSTASGAFAVWVVAWMHGVGGCGDG